MKCFHEHGGKTSEAHLDKIAVLRVLDIKLGQSVLDAGCGNGYMSKEFSNLVGENGQVYAIDKFENSIDQLKTETANSNIKVILGDLAQPTDLSDSSIDLIYLSMVYHGFTETERTGFLKEVKRLLKIDGILAIVEIDKVDSPHGPPMDIRYSPEELADSVGMKKQNCTKIGEYHYLQTFINEK
jgi:ubiquinone/menaquinone biosynthesis C-methylase UbiE